MTTDDHVMAILERANPVPPGELVDVPVGATRYLETALEQRSEPMTVIHPTPGRHPDQSPRRRWPLIAVAASVVAIVVASIAIVVAVRDDDTVVDQPAPTVLPTVPVTTALEPGEAAPTTVAAPDPTAAQAVVDDFFAAYNDGSTDDVLAMVAEVASVTEQYDTGQPNPSAGGGTRDDLVNGFAWNHAQREIWTEPVCELAEQQLPAGTTLSCQWDILDAVVQAMNGDPIPTNALIAVSDGMIVELHRGFGRPDFAALGRPFGQWLEERHPEVEGANCCSGDTREDSERRGELRAQWAREWADWLATWDCEVGELCSMPLADWVAEYDAQCTSLSPTDPLGALVSHIRLLPRPDGSISTMRLLEQADRTLIADGLPPERIAELQQQRLDAMVELGIDEACHPTVG